jgi:hypothetical protein
MAIGIGEISEMMAMAAKAKWRHQPENPHQGAKSHQLARKIYGENGYGVA